MDIIKGLLNGLFHKSVCYADQRSEMFKYFKPYLDSGQLIREITDAPRDSRYKIDYYHAPQYIYNIDNSLYYKSHSYDASSLPHIIATLEYLEIPDDFNPLSLIDNPQKFKDFTLMRITEKEAHDMAQTEPLYTNRTGKLYTYCIKYKNKIDCLKFDPSFTGTLINYNEKFWEKYKGKPSMGSFSDMLYQCRHYIAHHNLAKIKNTRTWR